MIGIYASRPSKVHAARVTVDNIDDLVEWVRSTGVPASRHDGAIPGVAYQRLGRNYRAVAGEWLVLQPDGSFWTMTESRFLASFFSHETSARVVGEGHNG